MKIEIVCFSRKLADEGYHILNEEEVHFAQEINPTSLQVYNAKCPKCGKNFQIKTIPKFKDDKLFILAKIVKDTVEKQQVFWTTPDQQASNIEYSFSRWLTTKEHRFYTDQEFDGKKVKNAEIRLFPVCDDISLKEFSSMKTWKNRLKWKLAELYI